MKDSLYVASFLMYFYECTKHQTCANLLFKFPDIAEFCEELANKGKTVIVAALDGTFQRQVHINM